VADHTISRIDPGADEVVSTQGGLTGPCNVTPDPGGGGWVTNCLARPYVAARIDPSSGQIDQRIRLPDVPAGVAFGDGDVWVVLLPPGHPPGTVLRIDPSTKGIVHSFRVRSGAEYAAFREGARWVGNADDGTVSKIDALTNRVEATIPVGTDPYPYQVTVGAGYVWVNNRSDRSTSKIDPLRNKVVDIIDGVRGTMAVQGNSLWVANPEAPTLWRIDTGTDEVTAQFDLPGSAFITTGACSIWVASPVTFDDQCCR
jgi:YVTN family beta-propeller protein